MMTPQVAAPLVKVIGTIELEPPGKKPGKLVASVTTLPEVVP